MDFAKSIETQQHYWARILRTTIGGWICDINGEEVFLPGSQLYDNIDDYEAYIGESIKVIVQKINRMGPVVSHKDYIKKQEERKNIIMNLETGQELYGLVVGANYKGYFIKSLGIIAYMPKRFIAPKKLIFGQEIRVIVYTADESNDNLIVGPYIENTKYESSTTSEQIFIGKEYLAHVMEELRNGFKVELNNEIRGFLSNDEIPLRHDVKIGDYVNVSILRIIDSNDKSIEVSIKQLLRIKQKEFIQSLIPNQSVITGKVVFIEKDLVTLHTTHEGNTFSVYIKKDDLAWESVQNCMDAVFLGEELRIRYKQLENGVPYFDLKFQQRDLYPVELFEMNAIELLNSIGFIDNRFIGKVSLLVSHDKASANSDDISGAFVCNLFPIGANDPNQLLTDIYTGAQIKAFLPVRYAYGLTDGCYYSFSLSASNIERRKNEHRPFMFIASLEQATPVPNPWKDIVEKSFKENKSPKSNRESASLLKEIGADMYTNRDRMFYELLQNADDASSSRGVKVMVQVKDNYLIFTHDGLPFSRQDFRSIVSTAYSTKKLDRKKTGYKGIGFKSVFTDSEKVYIKTGGFFFKFDKTAEIFNNFREFYRYVNPLLTEDQLEVFFKDNEEYEQEFEKVDHLPWQLLPFWVDSVPNNLSDTAFSRNCNVAIALDLGIKAEKYKDLIRGIIQKPRFMLFLRNTLRIQFEDKKWHILSIAKHRDDKTGVVKLKNSFAEQDSEVMYIVRDGNEIPVSNEEFEKCAIPMQKQCTVVAGREKWELYQIIDQQRLLVTSIPERIIASDTTTISYAFMLDDTGQASPIEDKTPSFYAYLPMEDRRYLLPFFVNADFELSSNRQEAKQESLWNEFIFYNIGLHIVSWVSNLAHNHQKYLYLLPSEYFKEELEESKIDKLAFQFNRGYRESLRSCPFILNNEGVVASQNDIIIDESGFADIIGLQEFCNLLKLQKRLPSSDIDSTPLANKDLFDGIEHLQPSDVIDFILDKHNRHKLLRFWCRISDESRLLVLQHISSMPRNKKNLFEYIKDIPAYTFNGRLFSFNKLLGSRSILLVTQKLEAINTVLVKLGFKLIEEEKTHPFHNLLTEDIEAYNVHAFEAISQLTADKHKILTIPEKVSLFAHFANSKYGLKQEQLAGWALFCNQRGSVLPLSSLTHVDSNLYGGITEPFVLNESEFIAGGKLVEHYLMKEKDQFEHIVIRQWETLVAEVGTSEELACALYKLASTTYKVAQHEQAKEKDATLLQDIATVFVNNQMHVRHDVFLARTGRLSPEVKAIIEYISEKLIPNDSITTLLTDAPFEYSIQPIEELQIGDDKVLTHEQVELLLTFCMNNDETIFKNYYLLEEDESFKFISLSEGEVVAYTSNNDFKRFIEEKCPLIKLLPNSVATYSQLKYVLTGEHLQFKVLECLGDVTSFVNEVLPFYKDAISSVRYSLLEHISRVSIDSNSFIYEDDVNLQLLKASSTIEGVGEELEKTLRAKVYIEHENNSHLLSEIKLQHSVKVGDVEFPISKLLPNEDAVASLAETLKERLETYVKKDFVDRLFGNEVDMNRSQLIYQELNKSSVTLTNGAQIGFILQFAKTNELKTINCKVQDKVGKTYSLDGKWYVDDYSFIESRYILNPDYSDLKKYLSLPFSTSKNQVIISSTLDDYQQLKSELNDIETFDLLDFMLLDFGQVKLPAANDISKIRASLNLICSFYIISKDYSLQEEQLPSRIEKWRTKEDVHLRTDFLKRVFDILDDNSDAVRVRQYLTNADMPTLSNNCNGLSELTSQWIEAKELILDDVKFSFIIGILSEEHFIIETDVELLDSFKLPQHHYLSFSDYDVYLYPGQIPHRVCLKSNHYKFHSYKEDDVFLKNRCIFINEEQLNDIQELIQSLINTDGFKSDDFVEFLNSYKSIIAGTLDGENDYDPDSEQREAANELAREEAINWLRAKQYDTSNVSTEFSLVKGVCKNGIIYHIVVKSFRGKKKELKLNPNEWLFLLKENSRLMLYLGHMTFAVIDRDMLLGNHDFLRLRIATSNFNVDGKLNDVVTKLAKDTQYFERTHFVFEHVHDNILIKANSLDDYNFYNSNVKENFSPGNTSDIE